MPTKRLNISIVDEQTIDELNNLRRYYENATGVRLSLADIVRAMVKVDHSEKEVIKALML